MTNLIPYVEDAKDVDYPDIRWSVSGNTETNQLHIKVLNASTSLEFEDVIDSPVVVPHMSERIFGIDIRDNTVARQHSDKMWEKYKDKLLP